uniref:Enoyl-CoA hydratase/isomerase domain-containing protein n=1 Tax=Lotharella oceanica TaxID=641309 RepID=A0A7S2TUS6_9EUKA|eukprot:CAMPEP_0170184008 /NCGR_PEP_ID=MMETSP0040_2-20121228/32508_1 /TAXON_ID=641309 /ORGANISM="Lotharella oceanica, Strain CCMP622" /LENGTH=225 /DNA_ID=CAMNT_0010429929 /DNA_START=21 /DNA_END=698 /DNA_ORIENTATION=+
MKVTLQMLHKAKTMSVEGCLQMEQRAMLGMFETNDYRTGFEAALRDSKVTPDQWEPQLLKDVSEAMVNDILSAPEDAKDDFKEGVLVQDIAGGELITQERATVDGLPLEQVPWLQDGHEAAKIEPYSKEYLESIGLVYPSANDRRLNKRNDLDDAALATLGSTFVRQQMTPITTDDATAAPVEETATDTATADDEPTIDYAAEDVAAAAEEMTPLEEAAEEADIK